MLKLKKVSKYYYNKGLITSGFSKINLELNLGEFVVITGESGSGKSTLLNVISGVDSYEEGEMYINGEETSHYNENNFEAYRKKYVSNIFQNFHLINSYTVYQNIELVLIINGYKKKEVNEKVLKLIKQVNLEKYKNKKVSKLSGGQKQRVAIARALAKDTPIVVADEPTGNLDVKSAREIVKLLSNIAMDKLVIIVTHNYEQFEEYATRKIKMHDGKILEDKVIKKEKSKETIKESNYKKMNTFSKIRLGIRNTFNVFPKFLLLLGVFLFILISISSEYTSLKKEEDDMAMLGYNQFFQGYDEKRIILNKRDKTSFTNQEVSELKQSGNIEIVNTYDLLLDIYASVEKDNFYFGGGLINIDQLKQKVNLGRLPKESNEILLMGNSYNYYLSDMANEILNKDVNLNLNGVTTMTFKVVGISYNDSNDGKEYIYMTNRSLDTLKKDSIREFSNAEISLNNQKYQKEEYSSIYRIVGNSNVKQGEAYIDEYMNSYCPKENCLNNKINIKINNIYFNSNINLKITKTYNLKNYEKVVNQKDYEMHSGEIYINQLDYDYLFNKDDYQISVYVNDVSKIDNTIEQLKQKYNVLPLKYALEKDGSAEFLEIFKVVIYTILTIALFFITYFVTKLILKSRNIYFSTMRILGTSKKDLKQILSLELINVASITYIIFLSFIVLNNKNIIKVEYIKRLISYLTMGDYILLYLIIVFMSYLISNRFSRALFKKSALKKYREEV